MYGGSEQNLQVADYRLGPPDLSDAFVDDAGKLQMRSDVYNIDSRTIAAIKSERGHLDAAGPQARRDRRFEPAQAGPRTHRRPVEADLSLRRADRSSFILR